MTEAAARPGALFHAGRLHDAVAAAGAVVKQAPTDLGARILLAELLAFSGNADRADLILDAASDIDPSAAVAVAEFRQLLRAAQARRQLFQDGRPPEFLGEPTPDQREAMAALVALRAGDEAEAGRRAAASETARPRTQGRHGAAGFQDFRDADDILAGSFEVLTTTGKYFWVPIARTQSLVFHPPKRPRDLLWRRATMQVADGPNGEVYLPAIYPTPNLPGAAIAEAQLLGRATDWQEPSGGPVRGLGLRIFLAGETAATILELGTLEFGATSA